MSELQRDCPECKIALRPIKLLDATNLGLGFNGSGHVELSYAAPDATRSSFLGVIERQGTVRGLICPTCGRILLYGVPKAEEQRAPQPLT